MIFFFIFSAVLFVPYFYVAWKYIITLSILKTYKQFALFILFFFYCFPLLGFFLHYKKIENLFSTIISWLGYIGLGIVSLLFFIHLTIEIMIFIRSLFLNRHQFDPYRRAFLGLSAKALAGSLVSISSVWGFYSALKTPVIKRVEIPIKNLPYNLSNLRIAQITDTHIGRMIRKDFVEKITLKIEEMNPDILVFTGDAADGSVEAFGDFITPLKRLKPPYGKYFVTGNHEYYSDLNGWLQIIEKIGFKILVNESQIVNVQDSTVMITGVPDRGGKYFSSFHKTDMEKAMGGMKECDLKILLAHQPKDVEYATKYGFHLQLSGHTHGGQYFPFSILVNMVHPFIKGLHKRGNTWVYINQGTGYWGPPIRIGTEPEITDITFTN